MLVLFLFVSFPGTLGASFSMLEARRGELMLVFELTLEQFVGVGCVVETVVESSTGSSLPVTAIPRFFLWLEARN